MSSVLNYNEKKVSQNAAELIHASGFLKDPDRMNYYDKAERFQRLNDLNPRTKVNMLHISLNFDPSEQLSKDQLKAIIERVERLEEEKKTISDDIRDVYAEAKGNGFDVKALRTIVRLRKQDENERAEQETILETYMQALGML